MISIAFEEQEEAIKAGWTIFGRDMATSRILMPGESAFIAHGKWLISSDGEVYPAKPSVTERLDSLHGFMMRTRERFTEDRSHAMKVVAAASILVHRMREVGYGEFRWIAVGTMSARAACDIGEAVIAVEEALKKSPAPPASESVVASFESRVMNVAADKAPYAHDLDKRAAFLYGHKCARHDAALIAAEADETIDSLR